VNAGCATYDKFGAAPDEAISRCVCFLSMLATAKGWRNGPGAGFNALRTNTGFDSRPCIRAAKRGAAARPKVKDSLCAVQLTPGRDHLGMLKGPRSDASASRNILRMFRNLDSRPRNRAGRVTRSVGHAHTMVHVRGRLGVDPPAGPAQLGSKFHNPYIQVSCASQRAQSRKRNEGRPLGDLRRF
jgi:hypothetical protein